MQYLWFALALLSVGLGILGQRRHLPWAVIAARWGRWFFIAGFVAMMLSELGFAQAPAWTLATAGLLIWFALESGYQWYLLGMISRSDVPLFPKFIEQERGDEWPSTQEFLEIRESLRKAGFRRVGSGISQVGGQIWMRISVQQTVDDRARLQVLFLPSPSGLVRACYSFRSRTRQGVLVVTDNVSLPFGGFYPEDWRLERLPTQRSVMALWERHQARVDALGPETEPFTDDPMVALNAEQLALEHLNRSLGFLVPLGTDAEEGRISAAGRYRTWWELWTLGYLGRARRY